MSARVLAHAKGKRGRSRIAGSFLIAFSLLPAVSILWLRASPSFAPIEHPEHALLMVVLAVSSFLLAVLLRQAQVRIEQLEVTQAEVIQKAGVDPLSNLPNRLFFEDLVAKAIAQSEPDAPIALISFDIDRFKNVNDTHGHAAGDRLITGIAGRIRRIVRDGDCLARIGGDEFALILMKVGNVAQCATMAHRILDAMMAPFDLGAAQVNVTLSLGIALAPSDGNSLASLSQAADLALYRAKQEGRNRFAFFDKTMEQKLHLGMTIEDDLRAAIRDDGLTIVYQPLMARCGTKMQGLEALVRWNHADLGTISPDDFIPLAESRGLIVPLGEWVLRRACLDAKRWPHLRMAVNVSPVQFRQRDFLDMVRGVLDATGIDPGRVDLEITEGVLIQDAEQAETVIMELRALGMRIGLDDFGSGYSSLIYLRRFAFDKIKIDRAFLGSLESSGEGGIILEYIVSLGHALGLTVTAEGVEDEDQLAFLQKLGCDEMQGFFFAPPLSASEIDERLSLEAWAGQPMAALSEADRSAA